MHLQACRQTTHTHKLKISILWKKKDKGKESCDPPLESVTAHLLRIWETHDSTVSTQRSETSSLPTSSFSCYSRGMPNPPIKLISSICDHKAIAKDKEPLLPQEMELIRAVRPRGLVQTRLQTEDKRLLAPSHPEQGLATSGLTSMQFYYTNEIKEQNETKNAFSVTGTPSLWRPGSRGVPCAHQYQNLSTISEMASKDLQRTMLDPWFHEETDASALPRSMRVNYYVNLGQVIPLLCTYERGGQCAVSLVSIRLHGSCR